MNPRERELIYDWNTAEDGDVRPASASVELNDETFRDGLQSPSVLSPQSSSLL